MLHREMIAVCAGIHTEHINKLWGHKVEILCVKFRGIQSNHGGLKWKATSHYPPPYILNFSDNFLRQTHLKKNEKTFL